MVVDLQAITDKAGESVHNLKANLEYDMVVRAVNQGSEIAGYLAIFEVRDSDGITVWLDIKEGTLPPGQAAYSSAVFSAEMHGDYALRSFVMEDSESPEWMSPIASTPFAVQVVRFPGIYVPLYKQPDLGQSNSVWADLIEAKIKQPSVPFVVTVNPSSGPGSSQDGEFVYAISELKRAGVDYILGYVPTDYGQSSGRSISEIKKMIENYRTWYPDVNGIMLDEVSARSDKFEFYEELASYARSLGFVFIRGNAGAPIDEEYLNILDNIAIFEGRDLPSISRLQASTHFPKYPPERFSIIARGIPSLDVEYLDEALRHVGLIYITDDIESDVDGNPYNRLPQYFEDLVGILNKSQEMLN